MEQKEFLSLLTDTDRLRFAIRLSRGAATGFVAHYEAKIGDRFSPIVRYDAAQGEPRRYFLRPDGTERLQEPLDRPRDQALRAAQEDLRANWRRYRQDFERELRPQ